MILVLAGLNACGSDNGTGTFVPAVPTALAVTAGNGQTGFVTTPLSKDLTVAVTDANGLAVIGSPVVWTVNSGGGTLSDTTASTNAYGESTVTWTLGDTPGPQTVSVAAAGTPSLSGSFTATAVRPNFAIASGNNQTAAAQDTVTDPLTVVVTDANGDPVKNVRVDFAVASGGGFLGDSAATVSVLTDAAGKAPAVWVLGPTLGTQTVTATVAQAAPVTFTAIATAPVAANLNAATATVLLASNYGLRFSARPARAPFAERARG